MSLRFTSYNFFHCLYWFLHLQDLKLPDRGVQETSTQHIRKEVRIPQIFKYLYNKYALNSYCYERNDCSDTHIEGMWRNPGFHYISCAMRSTTQWLELLFFTFFYINFDCSTHVSFLLLILIAMKARTCILRTKSIQTVYQVCRM